MGEGGVPQVDLDPGVGCIYEQPESKGRGVHSWGGPTPGSYMTPKDQIYHLPKGEITPTLGSRHASTPTLRAEKTREGGLCMAPGIG